LADLTEQALQRSIRSKRRNVSQLGAPGQVHPSVDV